MNSKKAVERIMKVLGLTQESFFESKTKQGLMVKMEGELELGQKIYVATEEGLIPAPPGIHSLEDGSELEVDDEGKLIKIDMGNYEKTMDEKKEEEDEKKANKDDEMSVDEFADVKLKDDKTMRVGGDAPSIGLMVKQVSYDGTLTTMTDGDYETSNGSEVISIVGGSISGIQSKADYEKRKTGFTIAELTNGVKVESPTFDVGEDLSVLDGDEKKKAPDGEHTLTLKDEDGKEVKIRVITKDGKIVERENVEEMEKTMMEIAEQFKKALSKFETKIDLIAQKQNEMETKFNKFSKEPAGSRVFTQKTINETPNSINSKYEGFKRMREVLVKN